MLSIYYLLGTTLNSEDTAVNQAGKNLYPQGAYTAGGWRPTAKKRSETEYVLSAKEKKQIRGSITGNAGRELQV